MKSCSYTDLPDQVQTVINVSVSYHWYHITNQEETVSTWPLSTSYESGHLKIMFLKQLTQKSSGEMCHDPLITFYGHKSQTANSKVYK